jgi:hypothetical protein
MKHNEPKSTLDWAAAHLFTYEFELNYKSGLITMEQYINLVEMAIVHAKCRLAGRMWDQFRLRWYDKRRIKKLEELRSLLPNRPVAKTVNR